MRGEDGTPSASNSTSLPGRDRGEPSALPAYLPAAAPEAGAMISPKRARASGEERMWPRRRRRDVELCVRRVSAPCEHALCSTRSGSA
eukprot:scaffold37524_cov65-Phaeocystis_antarctica.AAC.2